MDYESFVEKTKYFGVFGQELLAHLEKNKKGQSLQLNRWVKRGKLLRLKRGLYTLPPKRREVSFSLPWVANTLYSPSYLSLEYVLSWYDLIPERVYPLTSVTRLKTKEFKNPLGRFVYHHLKESIFFGFEVVTDECQRKILMATPEKALLDWLYLRSDWEPSKEWFEKALRLQQLDQLKKKRLRNYARSYSSKKMARAGEILLDLIENGI